MVDKQRETLYGILTDSHDLLTGGVRENHPSFADLLAEQVIVYEEPESPVSLPEERADAPPAEPERPESRTFPMKLTPEERKSRLEEIARKVTTCTACGLHAGRTYAVPGTGVLDPYVMIIGEGPGVQEDRQGLPFVGPAGQYLDRWLASIGLSRTTDVFIGNIVKCRPPGNRDPRPEESSACMPFLREQIELVRPRIILTLGRISTRILTGTAAGITSIHGKFYEFADLPLLPTFHPSAVLRNNGRRRPVWEDLKKLRSWLIENTDYTPPEDEDEPRE